MSLCYIWLGKELFKRKSKTKQIYIVYREKRTQEILCRSIFLVSECTYSWLLCFRFIYFVHYFFPRVYIACFDTMYMCVYNVFDHFSFSFQYVRFLGITRYCEKVLIFILFLFFVYISFSSNTFYTFTSCKVELSNYI